MSSTNPVTKRHTTQAVGAFFAAACCTVPVISALVTGREVSSSFVTLMILALVVGFHSLRAR